MKNKQPSKPQPKPKQVIIHQKFTYLLILYAYLFIPLFTPNFYTLDTLGPKFLALSLINLIAVLVLFADRDFRNRPEIQSGFFRNFIGLAYTLFLIINLVSFTQAVNVAESLITFVKIVSVFSASYILYVVFRHSREYVWHVILVFALLLLFDCFTVFYHILGYISKQVTDIFEIKSIYSNKNILSASLFIKIPAAIWLILYTDGWKKWLGYLSYFCGALATLFMSTRSFYVGLVLLFVALVVFFILRHYKAKNEFSWRKISLVAALLFASVLVYSFTQHFLYPKTKDTYNTSVVGRLETINPDEASANLRLTNWKRSYIMIKLHPLLGVGTGNWKIQVLQYESPKSDNFIISYKNHNDFIEVTAETGIIGGLIYLSVFLLILISFLKTVLDPEKDKEQLKYLFIAAFGILAYSVDAFFNFPSDRPEIQTLFALYLGMGIAYSASGFRVFPEKLKETNTALNPAPGLLFKGAAVFVIVIMGVTSYFLYENVISLHYQRYVFEDEKSNKFSHSADYFIDCFPKIPNISCLGAPITTYQARYLINENRTHEAIDLLKGDKTTPYDARREYYLSMAYDKLGNVDSTIYWGQKTLVLKPLFSNMVSVVSSRMFNIGRKKEAILNLDHYLNLVKTNADVWLQAADLNMKNGDAAKALNLLDTAKKYNPGNKLIISNWWSLHNTAYITPYEALYTRANQAFADKRYPEALKLLNEFIGKKPDLTEAYQNRALCLFRTGNYLGSLQDIQKAMSKDDRNEPFLLNLRGVNYISLGKTDDACRNFELAMDQGNEDGKVNYAKFCSQKK